MRGPLIAGIDYSTHAIHVALIPYDPTVLAGAELRPPERVHQKRNTNQVERLRRIRPCLHRALEDPDDGEIVAVYLEALPHYGALPGRTEMIEVFSAIAAAIPIRIAEGRAAPLTPDQWRKEVKLTRDEADKQGRNPKTGHVVWKPDAWKRASIARVRSQDWVQGDYPLNDHEADAILIAIAGRHMEWRRNPQ